MDYNVGDILIHKDKRACMVVVALENPLVGDLLCLVHFFDNNEVRPSFVPFFASPYRLATPTEIVHLRKMYEY